LYAQLCDSLMHMRNQQRQIPVLSVRILLKIASATLLQYINLKNNKPFNHAKFALPSKPYNTLNFKLLSGLDQI